MTASIVADVQLKTDKVTRAANQVTGRLRGLASSTSSLFKGVLGSAAVLKGLDLIGDGVSKVVDEFGRVKQAGSDLQQSTGAVDAVFGKYSKGIKRSAGEASQALGLSRNEYQELATVLGASFKNQGIKDFAGETKKVTALGADLAAQFGGSTREAVEAIGSLMRGETDPIERYGVSINQSAVSSYLASKGLDKLKGKALQQATAQARLALLFKQTKDAQGTFARESGTLAGIQQRNAAEWDNIRQKLGTALLPVFVAGAQVMQSTVIPAVSKVADWVGTNLPGAIERAKAVLGPFVAALSGLGARLLPVFAGVQAQLQTVLGALSVWLGGIRALFAAVFPIVQQVFGAISAAVQQSVPQLQSAYQSIASIVRSIGEIVGVVALRIKQAWATIGPFVLPVITSVFKTVIAIISGALGIVAGLFKVISSVLRGDWSGAWQGIKQIVSSAWSIIKAVVKNGAVFVQNLIRAASAAIPKMWAAGWRNVKSFASAVWSGIKSLVSSGINAVKAKFSAGLNAIKSANRAAWSSVRSTAISLWNSLRSAITSRISSLVSSVRALPGRFRSALSGSLYGAGSRLIGTLVSGIRNRINAAVDAVKSGLRRIRNLLPGSPIKDGPLKSWNNGGAGKRLMRLVAVGIRSESPTVRRSMEDALQPPRVNVSRLLNDAATSTRAGAAQSAAPTTINVKIDAPVGSSGVEIGRELLSFLKEYAASTGQQVVVVR